MSSYLQSDHVLRHVLIALVIVAVAFALSKLIGITLRRFSQHTSSSDGAAQTSIRFVRNGLSAFIFTVAFITIIYSIPPLRSIGVSLFAGAGILTIIIGFASQQAFANIVGGIFIVIFKPFRVGDLVEVAKLLGEVEDITLRHTVINNFENKRIVIPNSIISNETIINWNIGDKKVCNHLTLGVSYDTNLDKAIGIIQDLAVQHSYCLDNRTEADKEQGEPKVAVRVVGFGESSIDLKAYIWTDDPLKGIRLRFDLYKSIKEAFDREGVEIPFPYRTIVFKDKRDNELSQNIMKHGSQEKEKGQQA